MVSIIINKTKLLLLCMMCIGITAFGQDQADTSQTETENQDTIESVDTVEVEPVIADAKTGQSLFTGEIRFTNKGPSCISCHNLDIDASITAGTLAKDLTNAHSRLGDAGISAMLSSPPFPAMKSSYESNSLTDEEIMNITAFLKEVDGGAYEASTKDYGNMMITYGISGLVVLVILIAIIWNNRKRYAVKKDIFNRQIKST